MRIVWMIEDYYKQDRKYAPIVNKLEEWTEVYMLVLYNGQYYMVQLADSGKKWLKPDLIENRKDRITQIETDPMDATSTLTVPSKYPPLGKEELNEIAEKGKY